MIRAICLLVFLCTIGLARAQAQSGVITLTVVDAETGEEVPGAVIEIVPKAHPDQKKYYTSGYKGALQVRGLAYGSYTLAVTFMGYEKAEKEFRVTQPSENLGKIALREAAIAIETVVKEVQALRTSQKGDTVSYNANAFKVTADADVEGLLKKMPGITVNNGAVEAQGETIQKVFVDGKEFFGEDVTSAIKSLPAEAVERIEVYNKLSDQAEFSGMDDGESYKAINIVTRENMRQGIFGKAYAGYGYDADTETEAKNKYMVGGNVNFFSGSSRLSLIGLFNNVNQQNFSFEDILGVTGNSGGGHGGGRFGRGVGQYMVRHQDGVASVNAVGVNYSDTWGSRDQVTFQGSYFFNGTRTVNRARTERWYEDPGTDRYAFHRRLFPDTEFQQPPECPHRMENRGQPVADDPPGLEFSVERSVQYDLRATVRRKRLQRHRQFRGCLPKRLQRQYFGHLPRAAGQAGTYAYGGRLFQLFRLPE